MWHPAPASYPSKLAGGEDGEWMAIEGKEGDPEDEKDNIYIYMHIYKYIYIYVYIIIWSYYMRSHIIYDGPSVVGPIMYNMGLLYIIICNMKHYDR